MSASGSSTVKAKPTMTGGSLRGRTLTLSFSKEGKQASLDGKTILFEEGTAMLDSGVEVEQATARRDEG